MTERARERNRSNEGTCGWAADDGALAGAENRVRVDRVWKARKTMGRSKRQTRLLEARQGFTLIELLVVILIIGVLVAVSAPSFLGQTEKAHDSAAKQELAVAYREAKASAVEREGDFTTSSFDVSALASAIQASEPELEVVAGACPDDTTSSPSHVVIDTAATTGDSLELCNDPSHTVWYLDVVHGGAPTFRSEVDQLGAQSPPVEPPTAPVELAAPSLDGEVAPAQTLTSDGGSWSGSPTLAYQWQRSSDAGATWTDVDGTSSSYAVQSADVDQYLRLQVTASTNGLQTVGYSAVAPILYDGVADYSGTQGYRQWYYYQAYGWGVGNEYTNMSYSSGVWHGSSQYLEIGSGMESPQSSDAALSWKAPGAGNVLSIDLTPTVQASCGSDGVTFNVLHGDNALWTVNGHIAPGSSATIAISDVAVSGGDFIRFRLNQGGNYNCDHTYFDPLILFQPSS